jgi:murein DD-endopeptidase MepM/ murein hydrolase activator NlpD
MAEQSAHSRLAVLPERLFFSQLPTGEREFACFVDLRGLLAAGTAPERVAWSIRERAPTGGRLATSRPLTSDEQTGGRLWLAATLPPRWLESELRVVVQAGQRRYSLRRPIARYQQSQMFQLPLAGQVLVLVGHRLGETHRAAWQIPAQQFGWDLLPLDHDGLRLLRGPLAEPLRADLFAGFGREVLAPAAGRVVRAADGHPDGELVGVYPANTQPFLDDLRLAAGNHLVLDHGGGVYACLAHLQPGSLRVCEGQAVEASQPLGRLGNSGFSSGPHLHLHFMDGPELLSAAPLPVALAAEGAAFAPQAGQIIAT